MSHSGEYCFEDGNTGAKGYPKLSVEELQEILCREHRCDFLDIVTEADAFKHVAKKINGGMKWKEAKKDPECSIIHLSLVKGSNFSKAIERREIKQILIDNYDCTPLRQQHVTHQVGLGILSRRGARQGRLVQSEKRSLLEDLSLVAGPTERLDTQNCRWKKSSGF